MLPGIAVDMEVGELDSFAQAVGETVLGYVTVAAPGVDHVLVDLRGRHLAGNLSGSRAPHAIGDQIEQPAFTDLVILAARGAQRDPAREIRDEKGVLVVLARPAAIGDGVYGNADSSRGDHSG